MVGAERARAGAAPILDATRRGLRRTFATATGVAAGRPGLRAHVDAPLVATAVAAGLSAPTRTPPVALANDTTRSD